MKYLEQASLCDLCLSGRDSCFAIGAELSGGSGEVRSEKGGIDACRAGGYVWMGVGHSVEAAMGRGWGDSGGMARGNRVRFDGDRRPALPCRYSMPGQGQSRGGGVGP